MDKNVFIDLNNNEITNLTDYKQYDVKGTNGWQYCNTCVCIQERLIVSTVNQIITEAILNKTNKSPLKTDELRIFLEEGREVKKMKTMNYACNDNLWVLFINLPN